MKVIILIFFFSFNILAQNAIEFVKSGDSYFQQGDYENALLSYQNGLKINKYYKEAIVKIGDTYIKLNNVNEAIKYYESALKIELDYFPALLGMGDAYLLLKDYKKSLDAYQRIINKDPLNIEALIRIGRVYQLKGDLKRAIKFYKNILKTNPDLFDAHLNLGKAYFEENDLENATVEFEKCKEINYTNYEVYFYLGKIQMNSKNNQSAESYFKRALQLSPDNIPLLFSMADFYIKLKDYISAIKMLEKIVKKTPDDLKTRFLLSTIYNQNNNIDRAIDELNTIIKLNSSDEIALFYLENILILNKPFYDANRVKFSKYHFEKGYKYYKDNQLFLAKAEIRRGLQLNSDDWNARWTLAQIYKDEGYLEKYIEELQLSIKLNPKKLQLKDKLEIAIRDLRKSLSTRNDISQYEIESTATKIFVMNFETKSERPDIGSVISDSVRHYLRQTGKIKVVETKSEAEYILKGSVQEKNNSLEISLVLFSVAENKDMQKWTVLRQGNTKLSESSYSIAEKIYNIIPFYGKIIKIIEPRTIFINLGKYEGIKKDDNIEIYRNNTILGKAKIIETDEKISEAEITTRDTIDNIIIGDRVRIITK